MGICEDIFLSTIFDIVLWTNVWYKMNGEIGLDETAWLSRHFSGKLYRLGRLQFCLGSFENDYPAHDIKKGENVIEVHIPADGKLSFEECTASFVRAHAFLRDISPIFPTVFIPVTAGFWIQACRVTTRAALSRKARKD